MIVWAYSPRSTAECESLLFGILGLRGPSMVCSRQNVREPKSHDALASPDPRTSHWMLRNDHSHDGRRRLDHPLDLKSQAQLGKDMLSITERKTDERRHRHMVRLVRCGASK